MTDIANTSTDIANTTMSVARIAGRLALPITLLLLALTLGGCSGGDVAAAERAEDLAAREASLAERERELAGRAADLDRQEGELAELARSLDRRREELAGGEDRLAASAADLSARRAAVAAAESRLAETESSLADDRAELELRESRVAAERAEIERRETQVAAETERRERELAASRPRAVWTEAELAAGTLFDVELLSTVSSGSSRPGETFRARLVRDLAAADGSPAVPAGSEVVGTVVEAVPLKKVGGQARLGLRFDRLVLPSGRTVEISASFYGENREGRRDAAKIGGAAAGGAILGRILDRDNKGRATVLGAILGAAAGTAIAAGGEEVEIPAGAEVTLRLDEPAVALVPWRSRYEDS